jgi:hypothetical protein
MALNLPTYYLDSAEVTARSAEVPDADFAGGMNKGASNAPGVGVNTGDYDPKVSDWPRPAVQPTTVQDSNKIGGVATGLNVVDATFGDTALCAFVEALTGAIAPDGIIENNVAGFAMINRTGKTIPQNSWAWGVANNP